MAVLMKNARGKRVAILREQLGLLVRVARHICE
jgi:hypothetical protein